MCGRFRLKRTWREIYDLTGSAAPNLRPHFNIVPTQGMLAVRRQDSGHRSLVVADGYYEWETQGEGRGAEKLPWLFEIGDTELFAFDGIWEP